MQKHSHHHESDHKLLEKLAKEKQSTFERFPLLFTMLVTFGTVIVFSGASRLVAKVPFLYDNPIVTLVAGVLILLFTGTLYKKL